MSLCLKDIFSNIVCLSWREKTILFFCDIIKIPLTSILIWKLSLLFIYLFNNFVLEISYKKIWLSFVFWNLPCSENLIDRREPGICVPAVLKRLRAIFILFLFKIQIILIQKLLRLDIICLRFPKARDMFKIYLIFGHFQPHDFSLSSFLKQMQNWINIKLNTILHRY